MQTTNEPQVILVDTNDRPIGSEQKLAAHKTARLHRAFSVFLYNGDRMLIQKRAAHKYHSAGLWCNSCCSHPRPDEGLTAAVANRLQEELGLSAQVEEIFDFIYLAHFENGLYEHEYDHVFLGEYSGDVVPNPEEASETRWITLAELEQELVQNPTAYSVWFHTAAPRVITEIRRRGKSHHA